MKKSSVLAIIATLLAGRASAIDLVVSTDTLSPSSTIELRFDTPMVDKSRVGTVEKESPLVSQPPITGDFKWTSTKSGQFHFTKAPAFSTAYKFSTRAGLKDATGKEVEQEEFDDVRSDGFINISQWRDYPYSRRGVQQRVPVYLLQFSDAVNPAELEQQATFVCSTEKLTVPAKARQATGKDLARAAMQVAATWDELVAGTTNPKPKPDDVRVNAVVVESRDPLPVGKDWRLVLPGSFQNSAKTASLVQPKVLTWGSVFPMNMQHVQADTHFDSPHSITITFNKQFVAGTDRKEDADFLSRFVKVEPAPPGMKISVPYHNDVLDEASGVKTQYAQAVNIEGEFALETKYTVSISKDLAAVDGLGLEVAPKDTVVFHPSQVFVSTPAFQNAQLASGKGVFDIYAANFKDLKVRVKQLGDTELITARQLYTDSYVEWDDKTNKRSTAKLEATPFEKFPGKVVFEKTFANDKPLEKASRIDLNWHDILGQTPTSPLFVEVTGSPQEGAPAGNIINRSIVEFTDIGLILKTGGRDALVYAFSLKTGDPLPEVQLSFADKDRAMIRDAKTDAQGMASVAVKDAVWLLAHRGSDSTAINVQDGYSQMRMWQYGVNYAWDSPWKPHMETFVFSDRPVYKPGETAHVKAIARERAGDDFSLGGKPFTADLTVSDPRGRTILKKPITFTANGTWTDDIKFPESVTGWFSLQLKYPKPDAPAKKADDADPADEENAEGNLIVTHELRVDDYKPNTFEVMLEGSKFKAEKDRIIVPLRARYYMGKSLSKAKAVWNASIEQNYMPPQEFAEFSFGDASRWWHYGEDRNEETATEEGATKEWGANGEIELADDGTASIELPPPPPHKAALPQTINIYADVTDVNQQTISSTTSFQIPGADFIVGVKKDQWYGHAGKALAFDLVSITPEGKPFGSNVPVEIKVERQEWNTVRVQAAGGNVSTKNQVSLVEEVKNTIQVEGSRNGAKTLTPFQFTPKKGGTYFLTATAKDAKGLTVLSRVGFYVISNDGYPWAWEDGEKMTLQPDKTKVKPGEEVSIVVKSPFAGTALVTVERNRVHRQFLQPISPENPVVKLPFNDEDAPNAFVSVVVIRGAAKSPQPDPMPEYKIGYCEIAVEANAKKLLVTASSSSETVRPGDELTVSTSVKDDKNNAVEGAEVTLYAVDEGVLSLMSYETPKPFDFFHEKMPLAVNNYTTLESLLQEDMDKRERGNKGIVVGGGGDEGGADAALRKNFVATAVWNATLTTDKDGRVSSTFKVPDSLTRYRVMAVVTKGTDRFGTGQSAFVVNKPLMLEPVVPRFAHVGDEILVKAVLHNTTPFSGDVEVELKLDDSARLISEQRAYALVSMMKNRTMTNDGRLDRRTITLKAGETTALAFPVRFVKNGACAWEWRAHTVKWSDAKALSDAVESKFEVTHPAPALREVHYLTLTSAKADDNLLKKINPQLLEADGELRLDFNQSRLGEARDALEHLLHYPYGCVEQSTSSMLPWLALSKYETLFPDLLQKDKVNKAIQRGADRLLQMQTESGGLSYWPGGETPLLWASAYGGYGLIKAKEYGINISQESIDKLTTWMSGQLRELDLANTRETYGLCDAALALYTLAKAGKPEPSYQNVLYKRRADLPEMSRLFLALSMCLTKAPEKQITELIKTPTQKSRWDRFWLGENTASGLRLLVCAQLGLTGEGNRIADEVLQRRTRFGHWGTTFSNAWVLLGLATNERAPQNAQPFDFKVTNGDRASGLSITSPLASVSAMFQYDRKSGSNPLKVSVPQARDLHARLEVKAWPDLKTFQAVQKGFGITRKYQRLAPTGEVEEAKNLRVGDLIVVTLDINVIKGNRYLAIEDPLPSVFEPVNPEFGTQNQNKNAQAQDNAWSCDFRELRNDRALFFTDDWSELGHFELKYLARVIAEGDVIAPPARIEAMYEPDHYGLSDIQRVQTLPMVNGGNVVEK